jgi:hypothetical protein
VQVWVVWLQIFMLSLHWLSEEQKPGFGTQVRLVAEQACHSLHCLSELQPPTVQPESRINGSRKTMKIAKIANTRKEDMKKPHFYMLISF